jgi:hypothetical protein
MAAESGGDGGVLRELLAVFGFGVETGELDKGENRLNEFFERVKGIAEKVAAAFAVEQIYEFVEGQARAMNAIERTGQQLGITTDRVQEFQFAAKSMGLEADSLLNLMGRLQVSQQAAAQAGSRQSKAFAALGVNVRDANGHMKAADELTLDVADGISRISDPSKQAAVAVQLFGRQGRELLPFLKDGRAGAEEYFKTFRELGGGYTEDALRAGKDFDKQQAKTGLAMTGVKNILSKALLPIVTAVSHGVEVAAHWFAEMAKRSSIVRVALFSLAAAAAPFAISMAIAAAPLLLIAAAMAAVILAVDDLYTFLTGGDSETGEILDKIFGKGAQIDILEKVRDTWDDTKDIFEKLSQWVHRSWEDMKNFLDNAERLGVILRAMASGKNVAQAVAEYELAKIKEEQGPSENAKDFYRRRNAVAHGRVFRSSDETEAQAELKANIIRYKNPSLSPEFGPLPYIPGVSQPGAYGGGDVNVTVNPPPGLNEKQVGAEVAKQVGDVMKQKRREAAATLPRAGS